MANSNYKTRKNRLKKLEMPSCDGNDIYRWIAKAEQFFKIGQYAEDEKLGAVSVNLIGKVF